MDAKSTILRICTCPQCRGYSSAYRSDTHPRAHLLFCHLSVGYYAGPLWMVGKEIEEKPLYFLKGNKMAALPDDGYLYYCPDRRRWYPRPSIGPLLCLWTYRH